MKYLLFILLVVIVGCKENEIKRDSPALIIDTTASSVRWVRVAEKRRYFFVSYLAIDGRGNNSYGNFYLESDTLPSGESLENTAFKSANGTHVKKDNFIITGIYEFKDSIDYSKHKK